jgi:hypothetical protein
VVAQRRDTAAVPRDRSRDRLASRANPSDRRATSWLAEMLEYVFTLTEARDTQLATGSVVVSLDNAWDRRAVRRFAEPQVRAVTEALVLAVHSDGVVTRGEQAALRDELETSATATAVAGALQRFQVPRAAACHPDTPPRTRPWPCATRCR